MRFSTRRQDLGILLGLFFFALFIFFLIEEHQNTLCYSLSSSFRVESTKISAPDEKKEKRLPKKRKHLHAGPYYTPNQYEKDRLGRMVNYSFARKSPVSSDKHKAFFRHENEKCALNFYGLPRSFFTMTLHSVIENILIPNALLDCHAYVCYHYLEEEAKGRSGDGGKLNVDEIFLLEEAMRLVGERVHGPGYKPIVHFRNYTDEDLWYHHGDLLNATRVMNQNNLSIYAPGPDPTYTTAVIDNIVRMWHSQKLLFHFMEEWSEESDVNYTRVGMFRSDVFFTTPITILSDGTGGNSVDLENRIAVVPAFAAYPTNDRMIMGPINAVRPWATQRFLLFPAWLKELKRRRMMWWGIQSEQFLHWAVVPAIERQGVELAQDREICFLRVRPKENVWTNEGCIDRQVSQNKVSVEGILNRKCAYRNPGPQARGGSANIQCPLIPIR